MSDRQIYFVKPVGLPSPYKIGCSIYPANRLEQLMIWSPIPLELVVSVPGDFALERNLHECFAESRSHLEWFHASPLIEACIAALKAGLPIEEAVDLSDRKAFYNGWPTVRKLRQGAQIRISHAERRCWLQTGQRLTAPKHIKDLPFQIPDDAEVVPAAIQAAIDDFCADPMRFVDERAAA